MSIIIVSITAGRKYSETILQRHFDVHNNGFIWLSGLDLVALLATVVCIMLAAGVEIPHYCDSTKEEAGGGRDDGQTPPAALHHS